MKEIPTMLFCCGNNNLGQLGNKEDKIGVNEFFLDKPIHNIMAGDYYSIVLTSK